MLHKWNLRMPFSQTCPYCNNDVLRTSNPPILIMVFENLVYTYFVWKRYSPWHISENFTESIVEEMLKNLMNWHWLKTSGLLCKSRMWQENCNDITKIHGLLFLPMKVWLVGEVLIRVMVVRSSRHQTNYSPGKRHNKACNAIIQNNSELPTYKQESIQSMRRWDTLKSSR